jgi:signal transduction histidine kinase
MTRPQRIGRTPLFRQLHWFTRLRWLAGGTLLGFGAADLLLFHWHHAWEAQRFAIVGAVVLLYNAALAFALTHGRRQMTPQSWPRRAALAQILLDLGCLTLLVLWTGGLNSAILGFFVFHMVFASLLLSPALAYSTACFALVLLTAGLIETHQFPTHHPENLALAGIGCTLLLTVMLTNHVTRDLRRHQLRLVRQGRRVRLLGSRLRQHQRAMAQQEKMVALGQIAAGVAHEIANPLASMDSLLQLVQRKPERWGPEKLITLRDQIARINQTIQQMRKFAHPAEGSMESVPLNEVVDEAIRMVEFDRRVKELTITREFGDDVSDTVVMPQALQQVLVNLLINALDAMADVREKHLVVRTRRSAGKWYAIDVIDNGSGIAPEHLNRLFEPFFTTKPVGKGTGLGLSISYNLMRKQGGDIQVQSAPGCGATFTVRLPMREQRGSSAASHTPAIAAGV